MKLIDKDALVAWAKETYLCENASMTRKVCYKQLLEHLNTIEVKDVDLMIHTIIAECCDWLAMNTNLSHDEIEGCRNLMLTVKDEQFKTQKVKEVDLEKAIDDLKKYLEGKK